MVFIRHAVGVGEMGIQAAKLFCPLIHHFRKNGPVCCPGNMFCQSVADFIGRTNQDGIQALFYGKLLSHIHGNMAAVPGGIENGIMGKGNDVIQIAGFCCHQGS